MNLAVEFVLGKQKYFGNQSYPKENHNHVTRNASAADANLLLLCNIAFSKDSVREIVFYIY